MPTLFSMLVVISRPALTESLLQNSFVAAPAAIEPDLLRSRETHAGRVQAQYRCLRCICQRSQSQEFVIWTSAMSFPEKLDETLASPRWYQVRLSLLTVCTRIISGELSSSENLSRRSSRIPSLWHSCSLKTGIYWHAFEHT